MDIINFLESKMIECKQKGYVTNYYIAMDIANGNIEKTFDRGWEVGRYNCLEELIGELENGYN